MKRSNIRERVKTEGVEKVMRVKKGTLTPKMKAFAEQVALGEKGAQAYRMVYSAKAKPKTAGDNASRLKADIRIQAEVERIERAHELAALHSAEGLRSIVISTLAEIATNPDAKDAVRVQAVRSIGQLVGVDAFRETKRIEHVKDASEIREQILSQLKTITMDAPDVQDVEVDSLLGELEGDKTPEDEPHHGGMPALEERDSDSHEHIIPHEATHISTQHESDSAPSETPPSPFENGEGGGDIFSAESDVIK